MSQGIPPNSIGNAYQAMFQPALNRPQTAAPSVAQQLSRLQQSKPVLTPNFQDDFSNAAIQKTAVSLTKATVKPVVKEHTEIQDQRKIVDTQSLPLPKANVKPVKAETNQSSEAYFQQLAPLINDVQQVAQNSGYIDVRAEDVMRAYAHGSSLLADYSV